MDVLSFSSTDDATRAEVVQLRLGKYIHYMQLCWMKRNASFALDCRTSVSYWTA